ncbi:MFS transporter [Uliginosibacterium sp. sgz301328]|uniref:MFS transporter n=1 Tax=Uliginosibacterium sp. sgz301328 TaxID=3243764 RepID=UPI00359EDF07
MSNTTSATGQEPPFTLVLLLAVAAGLGVAALYYNQPILNLLAATFGASPSAIGWVPTLTQIGYAVGILFLSPAGDRVDRRNMIVAKAIVLSGLLLGMAMAQSLVQLCVLSVGVGVAASLAQDCVPAAAMLAPDARRGKIVGMVMMGLLLGILLSRVVSGVVGQFLGWRIMFAAAAVLMAALAVVVARRLPHFPPSTTLPYTSLLASLGTLWRRHADMRRAALAQCFLSASFSAFWSTLAVMLHQPPFGLGSSVAGAFGLIGAAGALAAPVAGGISDRHGPERVTRIGTLLVFASFASLAAWPGNLWLLVLATVVFDLGMQATLIGHQTIIYSLDAAARARLNALLIGAMFVGMASGSAIGSQMLDHFGWRGVCMFSAGAALAAFAVRMWPHHRQPSAAVV